MMTGQRAGVQGTPQNNVSTAEEIRPPTVLEDTPRNGLLLELLWEAVWLGESQEADSKSLPAARRAACCAFHVQVRHCESPTSFHSRLGHAQVAFGQSRIIHVSGREKLWRMDVRVPIMIDPSHHATLGWSHRLERVEERDVAKLRRSQQGNANKDQVSRNEFSHSNQPCWTNLPLAVRWVPRHKVRESRLTRLGSLPTHPLQDVGRISEASASEFLATFVEGVPVSCKEEGAPEEKRPLFQVPARKIQSKHVT